jgi:two-component system chemotaxis response regulator CheY
MSTPNPVRVLVVDDSAAMRSVLRMVLRSGGYEVAGEAQDGEEAVREAKASQPDLVLLDLAMPEMDGLTALSLLLEASPTTRIVVVSGFGDQRLVDLAMKAGARAYVVKGTDVAVLLDTLSRVANGP